MGSNITEACVVNLCSLARLLRRRVLGCPCLSIAIASCKHPSHDQDAPFSRTRWSASPFASCRHPGRITSSSPYLTPSPVLPSPFLSNFSQDTASKHQNHQNHTNRADNTISAMCQPVSYVYPDCRHPVGRPGAFIAARCLKALSSGRECWIPNDIDPYSVAKKRWHREGSVEGCAECRAEARRGAAKNGKPKGSQGTQAEEEADKQHSEKSEGSGDQGP